MSEGHDYASIFMQESGDLPHSVASGTFVEMHPNGRKQDNIKRSSARPERSKIRQRVSDPLYMRRWMKLTTWLA